MGKGAKRKNRTRIEIVASLLGIAEPGVRKMRLMYEGNLSFELLQKYLGSLMKAGMIEEKQEGNQFIYRTTAKGLQFLKDYNDFQKYTTVLESKKSELEKTFTI